MSKNSRLQEASAPSVNGRREGSDAGCAGNRPPPPSRWADFAWPAWVPEKLRADVQAFWSEEWHRGPRAWLENAADRYNHSLPLGTPVQVRRHGLWFTGRYVHAWNNMARVVRGNGDVVVVASHDVILGPDDTAPLTAAEGA